MINYPYRILVITTLNVLSSGRRIQCKIVNCTQQWRVDIAGHKNVNTARWLVEENWTQLLSSSQNQILSADTSNISFSIRFAELFESKASFFKLREHSTWKKWLLWIMTASAGIEIAWCRSSARSQRAISPGIWDMSLPMSELFTSSQDPLYRILMYPLCHNWCESQSNNELIHDCCRAYLVDTCR